MNEANTKVYEQIRSGSPGYVEMPRGLIAVWGREAVPFLDGMITNDVKTLEDGQEMLAAFPNAQGRLAAVVRVLKQGDRFLVETEDATREKVFQNLFRFTFAGDFFVEDLSDQYRYFEFFNSETPAMPGGVRFGGRFSLGQFVPAREMASHVDGIRDIPHELYKTLRIESGIPKYGIDMDETTIIPELGVEEMISYKKGCYIGQEIIARIHFRGHVAKRLTGLVVDKEITETDLTTVEGKNAGRITSVAYSPRLERTIALAYVRYDYLAAGTELKVGDTSATVTELPFIR